MGSQSDSRGDHRLGQTEDKALSRESGFDHHLVNPSITITY
jgi:hypothetical protein